MKLYIHIHLYMYIGEIQESLDIFLKTYIVNDLKAINDYQKKCDIRHGTDTYDVVSKHVTSARYQHQIL